jgi:hypothetical protein
MTPIETDISEYLLWMQIHNYARTVGGHEILPIGGHETARWWPTKLPSGGQVFCPR